MNTQIIAGRWTQFKGMLLEQWGRLKHDVGMQAAGRRDQVLGRISAAQGNASEQIEKQLRHWRVRHTQRRFSHRAL